MLGFEYLKYNDLVLPPPTSFDINFDNVENINNSEAGTKIGTVTALGLRVINVGWQVSSFWLNKLLAIGRTTEGYLTFNNDRIKVTARLGAAGLVENSELTPNTNGLYSISMTFTEVANVISQ